MVSQNQAMNRTQQLLFAARAVPVAERSVRVEVEGELDLATVPQLDEVLQQELGAGNDVILDLSKVTFMDSSGLHAIITVLRSSDSNRPRVRVGGTLLPQIRRLVEITGVQEVLSNNTD